MNTQQWTGCQKTAEDEEAEEDRATYFQRTPGIDGWSLDAPRGTGGPKSKSVSVMERLPVYLENDREGNCSVNCNLRPLF